MSCHSQEPRRFDELELEDFRNERILKSVRQNPEGILRTEDFSDETRLLRLKADYESSRKEFLRTASNGWITQREREEAFERYMDLSTKYFKEQYGRLGR